MRLSAAQLAALIEGLDGMRVLARLVPTPEAAVACDKVNQVRVLIWQRNIANIGMSSGKIATYMQYGLPVLINELGEISSHVREQGLRGSYTRCLRNSWNSAPLRFRVDA